MKKSPPRETIGSLWADSTKKRFAEVRYKSESNILLSCWRQPLRRLFSFNFNRNFNDFSNNHLVHPTDEQDGQTTRKTVDTASISQKTALTNLAWIE